jgi:hypothetical protein
MSKHQIIQTNQNEFNEALLNYERKVVLQDEIKAEITKLLPSVEVDETNLFKDVLTTFYSLVETEYKKVNIMRLGGAKLVGLLDINVSGLQELIDVYKGFELITKPKIEDYQVFAKNQAEKERLRLSKKVALFCNEVSTEHQFYAKNLIEGFNGVITYDRAKLEYKANSLFVKQTRY